MIRLEDEKCDLDECLTATRQGGNEEDARYYFDAQAKALGYVYWPEARRSQELASGWVRPTMEERLARLSRRLFGAK